VKAPQTFEAWRTCIEKDCGIVLTHDFVDARLKALKRPTDPTTARLIELYGREHLSNLVSWFEQAGRALP
jgi:hypothetical protein